MKMPNTLLDLLRSGMGVLGVANICPAAGIIEGMGYRLLVGGVDVTFLKAGAAARLSEFRQRTEKRTP